MPTALSPQQPGASSLGSSLPGPESTPRAMPTAPGQPPAPPQGGQQPELDWRDIMTEMATKNPGAKPEQLFAGVEALSPFLSMQSKQEWNTLKAQIQQQAENRKQTQGDTRLDQGQQRIDQTGAGQKSLADYRAARLAQADQALAAKAGADPKLKMRYDAAKTAAQQAEQTYRSALKGVSDSEYIMDEAAQTRAHAELNAAQAARTKAWGDVDKIMKSLGVGDAGAPAAGPQSPSPARPAAGATPAKMIKTPSGATAQASGYESPQYLGAPKEAKGAKPAAMEKPIGNTAPTVSASPNNQGQAPVPKAPPLDQKMRKAGEVYQSPRVGPVKWTGSGWVRVSWDGKQWVEAGGAAAK